MYSEVIVTGIIVSLVFTYFTGLSPAGLIVPGYIALSLSSPWKLLWTAVTVLATVAVYRLLSRFTILYGRRRFAVTVLISLSIGYMLSKLPLPFSDVGVVGYLIPAIIAKECDRQGTLKTLVSLAAAAAITAAVCLVFGVVLI